MTGKSDSGVMNIKKKVANLKQELDDSNDRANNAEAALREKEVVIDKVSVPCSVWLDITRVFDKFSFLVQVFP